MGEAVICSVPGCGLTFHRKSGGARGMCNMHYKRLLKTGTTELASRPPCPERRPDETARNTLGQFEADGTDDGKCHVPGCDGARGRKASGKFFTPVGLCNKHYMRLRREGHPRCSVEGCENHCRHARTGTASSEFCDKHYSRLRRRGSTDDRPVKPKAPPRTPLCRHPGCGQPLGSGERRLCDVHKAAHEAAQAAKEARRAAIVGVSRWGDADVRDWNTMNRATKLDAVRELAAWGNSAPMIGEELGARIGDVGAFARYWGIDLPNGHVPELGRHNRPFNAQYAPVEKIGDSVVRPGIDKHLIPLLLYRGNWNVGRAHRFWNFFLAMMEQECEDVWDGIRLSHHPDFSHLCGPDKKVSLMGLYGFASRLKANPRVTDNIPGFTEYVRGLGSYEFHHMPVPIESKKHRPRVAWRTVERRKPQFVNKLRPLTAQEVIYPFIMHDGKTDAGVDLVKEVNRIVPRGLPQEFRADVCQDIICAVLAGETTLAELEGADIRKFVATAKNIFADKWNFISIDAAIGDGDGRTFLDTFNVEASIYAAAGTQ